MTCDWITGQGSKKKQLQGIKNILELAEGYAKWVNEMMAEVWPIFLDKQL